MAVPKYRTSASKRDMRRSHHALSAPALSLCPNCGDVKQPHNACKSCGHYKGSQVLSVASQNTEWDGEGAAPGDSHDHKHDHDHDHDHHGHDHKHKH